MNLFELRSKLQSSKGAMYVIASVFFLTTLLQNVLFHWIVYAETSHAIVWFPSMLIKVSIALFFASFALLTKRKYWVVIVSAVFAFWCMAELIYFRSNNIFIEKYAFTMMGNMAGVWNSIWIFNKPIDWLLLLLTAILGIVVWLFDTPKRNTKAFAGVLFVSLVLNVISCYSIHRKMECLGETCEHHRVWNPFTTHNGVSLLGFTNEFYVQNVSVLHSLFYQIKELAFLPFENDVFVMEDIDKQKADTFVLPGDSLPTPQTPLLIILVESFEAWTITPQTTPNLYAFIQQTPTLLYADRVASQARHGVSADGQMIVNTGLLPITDGATCFRFPSNVYPAVSHLYQKPALIAALSLSYWNQKYMSDAYGIPQNYVVKQWSDSDRHIFERLDSVRTQHDFVLSMTITMHAPFVSCPTFEYQGVDGMPDEMYRYLNSVKYMDKQLGTILRQVTTDSLLKSSTIVITADHNVLSHESRQTFNAFNKQHQLGFGEINGYIPLVIYSPELTNPVHISQQVCQMDIYPTLLHILGCESYYWKGFGVNLLDQEALDARPITPSDAQSLSDKMIRADYFKLRIHEDTGE